MRRARHARYAERYFVGRGLDIGPGTDGVKHHRDKFPKMGEVDEFDRPQGNAQLLEGLAPNTYDFIHSSHCLEHLDSPAEALARWIEVAKPGGYLVITVPDEDLYEQGMWPSTYSDHQWSFTIYKPKSWSPKSVNIIDLVRHFGDRVRCISMGLHDQGHVYGGERFDQTGEGCEVDLEFLLQKL